MFPSHLATGFDDGNSRVFRKDGRRPKGPNAPKSNIFRRTRAMRDNDLLIACRKPSSLSSSINPCRRCSPRRRPCVTW